MELYREELTFGKHKEAERLAKLIRDIDKGLPVDPLEKQRLYGMGDEVLRAAVAINQKLYRKKKK